MHNYISYYIALSLLITFQLYAAENKGIATPSNITQLALLSTNLKDIALACQNNNIYICSEILEKYETIKLMFPTKILKLSPDQKTLAALYFSQENDNYMTRLNIINLENLHKEEHLISLPISDMIWLNDKTLYFSCNKKQNLTYIYDINNNKITGEFKNIYCAWSKDFSRKAWQVAPDRIAMLDKDNNGKEALTGLGVNHAEFNCDTSLLLATYEHKENYPAVNIWNTADGKPVASIGNQEEIIWAHFLPQNNNQFALLDNNAINIWDIATMHQTAYPLKNYHCNVKTMDINNKYIAVARNGYETSSLYSGSDKKGTVQFIDYTQPPKEQAEQEDSKSLKKKKGWFERMIGT